MEILRLCLKIFSLYFAVIAAFTVFRSKNYAQEKPKKKFAVLLAARNEEAVIESTVKNIFNQDYPKELFDIFVIPNNCTDKTEEKAREAGAKIIHCTGEIKNKGDALGCAARELKNSSYDVYCVFDADNLVDSQFLQKMNDVFCKGANVAKGKQRAMNPYDSWVSGCYDIYFEFFNVFFNRPRRKIGLSAKLVGTGFAVSREFINKIGGWNTLTFAEDAEFSAQCAKNGERVWWVPEAITYDEEPVSFKQSVTQRKRWSSGVMEVARLSFIPMIKQINRQNRKYSIDFIMFIINPIVQVISLVPTAYYIYKLLYEGEFMLLLCLGALSYSAAAIGAAFLSIIIGKRSIKILKSAVMFPVFLLSWIPLQVLAVFKKTKTWQQIVHNRSAAYYISEKRKIIKN